MALKKKKSSSFKKDQKKERIFRLLADCAVAAGVQVRREQLRRGHGWKASSGGCLLRNANLILIDQALGQDEQIDLMVGYLRALSSEIAVEVLEQLPTAIRAQLTGEVQQQAA